MTRINIELTPMHQEMVKAQQTLLHAVVAVGIIALTFFTAYQAVKVDRQIGYSQV